MKNDLKVLRICLTLQCQKEQRNSKQEFNPREKVIP